MVLWVEGEQSTVHVQRDPHQDPLFGRKEPVCDGPRRAEYCEDADRVQEPFDVASLGILSENRTIDRWSRVGDL